MSNYRQYKGSTLEKQHEQEKYLEELEKEFPEIMTQPNKDNKPDDLKVWKLRDMELEHDERRELWAKREINTSEYVVHINREYVSKEDFVRVLEGIKKIMENPDIPNHLYARYLGFIYPIEQQLTKKACTEHVEGEGKKDG